MVADLLFAAGLAYRFRSYSPQKVTVRLVLKWLAQFPPEERGLIKKVTSFLQFVRQRNLQEDLLKRNAALLRTLQEAGISLKNIVYVSISDAGSSSHVVLNMLRDAARLESAGCKLVDAGSIGKLHEITDELESGAIIYVDDFSGTGTQFCDQHNLVGGYIVGNFSQFFLLHTICEEALKNVAKTGVEVWQHQIHQRSERPLSNASSELTHSEREILVARSKRMAKKGSLGYRDVASMVVFERNAPNTVPLLFRGDKGQNKYIGFIPRTTDLPPVSYL